MRSVLDYEMDYIFKLYSKKVTLLGFDKMAKSGYKKLQNEFALKYNDLFKQIKGSNEKLGKSKEEVSYAILKIRRLIALWEKEGIIKVEGGVKYSANDKHQEFPIFGSQHFEIAPTKQTIYKLQAKAIDTFIESFNHRIDEANIDHKYRIKNLRDLRLALIKHKGLDATTATKLTDIYRQHSSKSDVYGFAKNTVRNF